MDKTLVLLTGAFPFMKSEPYLETEIHYLCNVFSHVIIIPISHKEMGDFLPLPDNCKVIPLRIPYSFSLKLKSLRNLLSSVLKKEKQVIKTVYKKGVTLGLTKTMLISLERGKRIKRKIEKQGFNYENTLFYSYWCEDTAVGLALLSKQNAAVKAISRMHRWEVYFEENKDNYLPFRHLIANNLLAIYSISQDGADYAVESWKVAPSKIQVSKLGVYSSGQLTIPENKTFRILSCSTIVPVKRVKLIAESLSHIKDYSIEWMHFGEGKLEADLKLKIESLGENIYVDLRGWIPNKAIYEAYKAFHPHLFINVSSSEGIPVSIMEAMSLGIPALATNVGGNKEIVNDENGRLISVDVTAREVADEIIRFIKLSELEWKQFSDSAYKTWKEQYNADRNYKEFADELLELLEA